MVAFASREYLCSLSAAIAPALPPALADALESTWTLDEDLIAHYRGPLTEAQAELIAHGRAVCKARGGSCAQDAICREFCSEAKRGARARRGAE